MLKKTCLLILSFISSGLSQSVGLTIDVDCSTSLGPLVPFWRSVGYTPATYALRDDELENTLNIGSVPNRGVTQVRIHYILDLLVVLGYSPDSSTPSGYTLDYDFGEIDHAMDFLIANDLSPGYEIMGSPRGFPTLPTSFYQPFDGNGKIQPDQTQNMFRQLIGDLLVHSIERYGVNEVESWHLESWNEPDQGWGWNKVQNQSDPTLAGFVNYWDAMTAGLEDAEVATGAKLFFGGTASGRAAGDVYFLPAILRHKSSGKNTFNGNPVRLDYITAHVKGESTSYVTVQGEWAVSALIRSNSEWVNAGLGSLPISNDEGDPMVGWEVPEDWRGDARYSSIIPKMVNQHLQCISDNATVNNPLGLLSFDGAFLNGVGDNYTGFGMRTMTTRFGLPRSRGPFAFVKKSGLAAFTLLSRLGNERCSYTGAPTGIDTLSENAGVLTTMRKATANDAAQASVIVYNSVDCDPDTTPSVAASVSLSGLPFPPSSADGSVVAVLFIVDQMVDRNPAALWAQRGSPGIPTSDDLVALWASAANMTSMSAAPLPIAVGTGGTVTLPNVSLSLPSAILWHLAEKATSPTQPAAPVNVVAYYKEQNASFVTKREIMVRWSCATVSRVIGSYIVQVSPSGSSSTWNTIPAYANDITCSFVINGDTTFAEGAKYRVAAVDYWSRQSSFSVEADATPWPTFSN